MRNKEERLIITFGTVTDAMAFEAEGKEAGLNGRLIPVPRAVTAGCGLAWSEPSKGRADIEQMILYHKLAYEKLTELVI